MPEGDLAERGIISGKHIGGHARNGPTQVDERGHLPGRRRPHGLRSRRGSVRVVRAALERLVLARRRVSGTSQIHCQEGEVVDVRRPTRDR